MGFLFKFKIPEMTSKGDEGQIGKVRSNKVKESSIFFKRQFKRHYRKAGCCSTITYSYAIYLINAVNERKQMGLDLLEDMNVKDSETEDYRKRFIDNYYMLLAREKKKKSKKPINYGSLTWWAVVRTFWFEYFLAAILNLCCELSSVTYIYTLIYLIGFLRD